MRGATAVPNRADAAGSRMPTSEVFAAVQQNHAQRIAILPHISHYEMCGSFVNSLQFRGCSLCLP